MRVQAAHTHTHLQEEAGELLDGVGIARRAHSLAKRRGGLRHQVKGQDVSSDFGRSRPDRWDHVGMTDRRRELHLIEETSQRLVIKIPFVRRNVDLGYYLTERLARAEKGNTVSTAPESVENAQFYVFGLQAFLAELFNEALSIHAARVVAQS